MRTFFSRALRFALNASISVYIVLFVSLNLICCEFEIVFPVFSRIYIELASLSPARRMSIRLSPVVLDFHGVLQTLIVIILV